MRPQRPERLLIRWSPVRIWHGLPELMRLTVMWAAFIFDAAAARRAILSPESAPI